MWRRRTWLLILLAGVLVGSCDRRPVYRPAPLSGEIRIRTNKPQYNRGEDVHLIISNGTSRDILIPVPENLAHEKTLHYYQETTAGWTLLLECQGCSPIPIAYAPGLQVLAGQEAEVDITENFRNYTTDPISPSRAGQVIVQVHYVLADSDTDPGWVQYSPPFVVPPNGVAETIAVTASLTSEPARALIIENGSSVPLWFPYDSIYGNLYQYEEPFNDRYLDLQRRTGEGTWQVLQLPPERWRDSLEPTRIGAGQAVTIELHPWFQEKMAELGPGVYRWDVVLYPEYDPFNQGRPLWQARHIFSEPFDYSP